LKSVVIPESVTSIGFSAFFKCGNLTSVNLSSNLETIGHNAFRGCASLKSIDLPEISMGSSVFRECTSLESVTMSNDKMNVSLRSMRASSERIEIGSYSFADCVNLVSVVLPKNLSSIGMNTFSGCTSLKSTEMLNNIEKIDSYAFEGCTRLKHVVIPGSVVSIGSFAFNGCTGINAVTYGGVSDPGESATEVFNGTSGMTVCVSANYTSDSFCGYPVGYCHVVTIGGEVNGVWGVSSGEKLNTLSVLVGYLDSDVYVVGDIDFNVPVGGDTVVKRDMNLIVMNRNIVIIDIDNDINGASAAEIAAEINEAGLISNNVIVNVVTEGNKVIRIEVFVSNDDSAKDLTTIINDLDKNENCTYSVLCQSKGAHIEVEEQWLESADRNELMIKQLMIEMITIIALTMLK